jgi:hypothetical protein
MNRTSSGRRRPLANVIVYELTNESADSGGWHATTAWTAQTGVIEQSEQSADLATKAPPRVKLMTFQADEV